MRAIRILLVIALVLMAGQALAYKARRSASPFQWRTGLGVATAPSTLDETVDVGGSVELGFQYRLSSRINVGLRGSVASHDYDELDGVPLGPGYYDPDWYRFGVAAFGEYMLLTSPLRPYLAIHGGFQSRQLAYSVDRPGRDKVETETGPALGLLGLGGGLHYEIGDGLGVRLEALNESRPGHWDDAAWTFMATVVFSVSR